MERSESIMVAEIIGDAANVKLDSPAFNMPTRFHISTLFHLCLALKGIYRFSWTGHAHKKHLVV